MGKWKGFTKAFGPGVLFATTCIGVSHLVQSTRAGADYGYQLIVFVVLANVLKFPFFEFGARYANATGTSLLRGYLKQGRWMLYLYLLITILTMFTVTGAVTFVTAGLLGNLLQLSVSVQWLTAIVFVVSIIVLLVGRFRLLDGLIKVIGAVLLISTLAAFVIALWNGPANEMKPVGVDVLFGHSAMLFIIALMGWMPTAVDLSAWSSIWTVERIRQTGYKPSMRQTLLDFNIGYWISALLAICYLVLGAYLLHGNNEPLPDGAVGFAAQLITMFTQTLGGWSYWLIAVAAFSVMFSTSITVLDGYSRALSETFKLLFLQKQVKEMKRVESFFMVLTAVGAFILVSQFSTSLSGLVDLATTLSFLVAPFIAVFNFRVVNAVEVDEVNRPGLGMRVLSYVGIIFLFIFSFYFLYIRFL